MKNSRMLNIVVIDENVSHIFYGSNYPVGGASVQTYSWIIGLARFAKICVLSTNSEQNFKKADSDIYIINFKKSFFNAFFIIRFVNIFRIIRKLNPDIIYVSTAGLNTFIYGLISEILRIKYVQRISNDISYVKILYRRRIGLMKSVLSKIGIRFADIVLCQNLIQVSNLSNFVNKDRIHLVYNPFYYEKMIIKKKGGDNYIAWIGIFKKDKNIKELYNIALQLPNYNFKIAGQELSNIDKISKKYVEALKALPNVDFVGLLPRTTVLEFLSNATCLLNTSFHEGFSNTYLEAFSVGCPVVTRRKTDPDGIIAKYQLGISTESYKELPIAIESVFSLKDFDKYLKRGQEYLDYHHNPYEIAKYLLKLIHK